MLVLFQSVSVLHGAVRIEQRQLFQELDVRAVRCVTLGQYGNLAGDYAARPPAPGPP